MMTPIRTLLVLLSLALSACAKRVPPAETFAGSGMRIHSVEIECGELPPEREEVYSKLNAGKRIVDRTTEILAQRGLYDKAGDVKMKIEISDFRVRHGATRFFTGFYSGSDHLIGRMTLLKDGLPIFSKEIQAAGGNGNPFAISRASRGANLIDGFAKLGVASLVRDSMNQAHEAAPTVIGTNRPKHDEIEESSLSNPTGPARDGLCSVEQIMAMKKAGMSEGQISAACGNI